MSRKPELFNLERFAEIMTLYRINKRKKSQRDAAKEIGISASTLNRIELRKFLPDLETYFKCCQWIGYDMKQFFLKNYDDRK